MSTTIHIDAAKLREQIEELRAATAEIKKQMDEIGMLLVLAEKYNHTETARQPIHVTGTGALKAVGNAIIRGQGETKHSRIISACSEILADGVRRLSRELMKDLRERGIEVSANAADATKEAAALSSYLSKEKAIFASDVKAGGWTLKRLSKKVKPDDVGASPGFGHNGVSGHQGRMVSASREVAEFG